MPVGPRAAASRPPTLGWAGARQRDARLQGRLRHPRSRVTTDQTHGPPPGRAPGTSDLLADRYVLEERIATGGMAAVWRAHDEVLARTVAVKILHDDLGRQDGIRERFRREAIAAAKLVH